MSELCYINNPNSLFRKYHVLISYLTRHKLFRDYIGLSEKVDLLLPNGYHTIQDDRIQATIYSRAIYASKLYPALQALDLIQEYIKDFKEAEKVLAYQLGLIKQIPSILKSYHFNTLTVNPDANPESTSVDGWVYRAASSEDWATIRAGAGTTASDTNNYSYVWDVVASTSSNKWNKLLRSIYLFDTSSLTTSATINSATFSIYMDVGALIDFSPGTNTDLVTTTPASNTGLATGDYGNFGTTLQANTKTNSSMVDSQYNDWTINATGIGNISMTGITKYGCSLSSDTANSAPAWASGAENVLAGTFADNASNKPKLTIDYTLPTTARGDFKFL